MKTGKKRLLCIALALAVVIAGGCAAAEGSAWTCPNCGQSGNTGNFCSNCGTARPSAGWTCPKCGQEGNTGNFCTNCGSTLLISDEINEFLEQIPGETDRVKVCVQAVSASSYISNKQNPSLWIPENAADGDESTCWQFSDKKGLKGKTWILLQLEAPQDLDAVWIKNGFWAYNDKGGDQYPINSRLKQVRIDFMYANTNVYEDAQVFTLEDDKSRSGWQKIELGHLEDVEAIRLTPLSIYKGSKYPHDVCVSEIMPVQYASASIAKEPPEQRTATVYESRPDVTGVSLKMKLATRSGPGTAYDEPGTFFPQTWKTETVLVLGKSYNNGTWWVLVDFNNGGKGRYRVWTGLKRVDVDLNKVKEYYAIGQGTVDATSETYRGPGGNYAKANITIRSWKDVEAYARENGYVEVEYQEGSRWYRVWVPERFAHIDWTN